MLTIMVWLGPAAASGFRADPALTVRSEVNLTSSEADPAPGAAALGPARAESPQIERSSALPVLRYGSRGDHVRWLQSMLNGLASNICPIWEPCRADFRVAVDGRFGPDTRHAVVLFQRQELLRPDGTVGPKTWERLQHPRPRCEATRIALERVGATAREIEFGVKVARRESQCALAQVVYRPSTGDYSWGPWGVNFLGSLSARADPASRSYLGPMGANTVSWESAARMFLKLGRTSGWCHWDKAGGYCAG